MSKINEIEQNIVGAFNVNSIKEKIVSGINIATKEFGIKLVNGEWVGEGSACALGCMLLADNGGALEGKQSEYEEAAAEMLGVSSNWISAFITGFDAEYWDGFSNTNREAYELGTQLRIEFDVDTTILDEPDE